MSGSHKYTFSEGCCICATKNSTSQFRPWYEHYSEDVYCRVFTLHSLDGRRGHVCNPCVLYIKRAIDPSKHSGADHSKRLDRKLKGGIRPLIKDLYPQTDVDDQFASIVGKEQASSQRKLTLQPRYVYVPKGYIRMKSSKFSSGSNQDAKEVLLEDEDGAIKDLPYYRPTTLVKKGGVHGQVVGPVAKDKTLVLNNSVFVAPHSIYSNIVKITSTDNCNFDQDSNSGVSEEIGYFSADYEMESYDENHEQFTHAPREVIESQLKSVYHEIVNSNDDSSSNGHHFESTKQSFQTAPAAKQKAPCRRILQQPMKNRHQNRKVSWFDCSYWLKYCNGSLATFIGENGTVLCRFCPGELRPVTVVVGTSALPAKHQRVGIGMPVKLRYKEVSKLQGMMKVDSVVKDAAPLKPLLPSHGTSLECLGKSESMDISYLKDENSSESSKSLAEDGSSPISSYSSVSSDLADTRGNGALEVETGDCISFSLKQPNHLLEI